MTRFLGFSDYDQPLPCVVLSDEDARMVRALAPVADSAGQDKFICAVIGRLLPIAAAGGAITSDIVRTAALDEKGGQNGR